MFDVGDLIQTIAQNPGEAGALAVFGAVCQACGVLTKVLVDAVNGRRTASLEEEKQDAELALQAREVVIHEDESLQRRYLNLQRRFDEHILLCTHESLERTKVELELRTKLEQCTRDHNATNAALRSMEVRFSALDEALTASLQRERLYQEAHLTTIADVATNDAKEARSDRTPE